MPLFLVTTGDGSDGNEWDVVGIFTTRSNAEACYEWITRERTGTNWKGEVHTYRHGAEIEEWLTDCWAPV